MEKIGVFGTGQDKSQEFNMLIEVVKRLRNIHEPKFRHRCIEWDGLEIDEFDPEFGCCTCFVEDK